MAETDNCHFCSSRYQQRSGRPSLWCSVICRDTERAIDKARLCKVCGFANNRAAQSMYCSEKCRATRDYQQATQKRLLSLKLQGMVVAGETGVCALKTCGVIFLVPYSNQKFCSSVCRERFNGRDAIGRGDIIASRIYFGKCKYCQAWKSTRAKWSINRLSCNDCQQRRTKENDTKKNHRRRAAGELVMTVQSLVKRDGVKCNICTKRVDMSKSGLDPLGPTIDHLLPVSKGGTNDSFNLALAHRRCNTSRGNRGHAQLLLEIDDAWATA